MGFKSIFNKIIEFILSSKLSIELDEYKIMVGVLVSSLKNDNKSNRTAIDGIVGLKDRNNDLLEIGKVNKDNFCISLLVVSALLIYSHLKSFS